MTAVPLNSGEVSSFYDEHSVKFLTDYLFGNQRVRVQWRFFEQAISRKARRIALIGSGSGEGACHVVSRCALAAEMVAADISPRCIELGSKLFAHPRLRYVLADVTGGPLEGSFDTILLPDVYEHIPKELRGKFHGHLKLMLTDHGRVLITAPTPAHQASLRAKGEGLQIIDEDVTLDDLRRLAEDIGGVLSFYALVNVGGGCNGYFHAAIEKSGPEIRMETENDEVEIRKFPRKPCWPRWIVNQWDRFRKLGASLRIISKLGVGAWIQVMKMKGKRPVVSSSP